MVEYVSNQKVTFREFNKDDLKLLKQVFQNSKVMKYTLDDRFSDKELNRYLEKIVQNNGLLLRKTYEYAVFNGEEYIGFADYTIQQKHDLGGVAEIGYLLLPQFWGKGFGSEIAKQLINICFVSHKLHRVCAKCNSKNLGSKKVLENNGMSLEGRLIKQRFKNGEWQNEDVYALINPSFI